MPFLRTQQIWMYSVSPAGGLMEIRDYLVDEKVLRDLAQRLTACYVYHPAVAPLPKKGPVFNVSLLFVDALGGYDDLVG